MRGIIFRTYLNFIKENYGYETLDKILLKDEYPNKGGFSTAGNYSSKYLLSLVSNTTYLFENSTDKVLEAFGIYSFKFLLNRFKKSYKGTNSPLHTNNAYNFLEELNVIHFDELRKLYPDARFPKFDIERIATEHIIIEYSSNRNLPHFVYGLIKGCLKYFNDSSDLSMQKTKKTKLMKGEKVPVYRFEVKTMDKLTQDILLRQLEREQLARRETEDILERITLELYHTNQKLQTYLNDNELLLRQYKDAVDEGTIVSKTDPKGIITYVNDEFCKISGYTKTELIGKPHSVVRCKEMSSDVFKKLWSDIKNKKTWQGVMKNRAKNGSVYVVQATVKPILNSDGDIVEFMAIRQDITEVYNLQMEVIETQREMLEKMGELAESRSQETGNHVKRVAEYSATLARLYGLEEEKINMLKMASPMHDIGKIAIPDEILLKPGKLNNDEFETMKTHAQKGHSVFKNSKRELLKVAAIVANEHHERWGGKGYPRGLSGEDIHIYGRITALADVFDALGSERVYKNAWNDEEIFKLLKEESGKQFDPKLVEIFFENLDEFLMIRSEFRED